MSRRYGALVALDSVDLHVRRGEILGVIGPNGAGKTTLINCISGIEGISGGQLLFEGCDISPLPAHRRGRLGIARTFQIVRPLRQLTVRENVATGAMYGARGHLRSAAEALAHADEVILRLGLAAKADRIASDLTIPDLKRLEMAKAVAMDPKLLLLDEVMAGLNLAEVERAMDLIRAIRDGGVTILVIEHVMNAIMGLSDRLLVLHQGQVIVQGRPQEVVDHPGVIEAYLGKGYGQRVQQARSLPVKQVAATTGTGTAQGGPPASSIPESPPLLSVGGMSCGYRDMEVVTDVTLEVRRGEIVALIGANGAGKTTLLLTISRILRARAGTLHVDGQMREDKGAADMVTAGVVHVPQGRRLFAGLSVEENLLQGAYLRRDADGVRRDLQGVYSQFPRLAERRRQLAGKLSGGEQQMCAIGRGLMAHPRLLIIDELSLGLAPVIVEQLMALLLRINAEGTSILLVDQDVQTALEHAHRGYVIETGRIVQSGPAADLLDDPAIRTAYLGLQGRTHA